MHISFRCTAFGLATLAATPISAQSTYCNPLDIDYKYNFEQMNAGISYRAGADPVIVRHDDAYYLFITIAGGYWRSTDLLHWSFITPSRWPFEDIVAPAALSVRDTLYLFQSTFQPRPILFSTAPETGRLEFYNRLLPSPPGALPDGTPTPYPAGALPPGPWDPDIFHDPDTDRWYMYWGSSNVYPIYGIELDKSRRLSYLGTPVPLISLHPNVHGWERFGRDNADTVTPYIEGAWMTKYRGKYYLQYAAPGTEYNAYANGTYVGDQPLGPFTYAPYNPVSAKPGGFVIGAGHGNTFEDAYGNWWNTGTNWVAINWNFERRVVMFPAGFDADGEMFSDTRFGDFPHFVPTAKWTRADQLFTGWMLLSYRKRAIASSVRDTFPASNVTDENVRTFWLASTNTPREWLAVDLGREYTVRALQVNYADWKSDRYASDSTIYTQFRISQSHDGKTWSPLVDQTAERRDRPNAYIELPSPVRTRFIRYEHVYVGAANLAISDLRVFGNGGGKPPDAPRWVSVTRATDPRDALVSWHSVPGAVGYNVRWGIAKDKLYQTYQRFADQGTRLRLRSLSAGVSYWFAVEAFDENGVSGTTEPVFVK